MQLHPLPSRQPPVLRFQEKLRLHTQQFLLFHSGDGALPIADGRPPREGGSIAVGVVGGRHLGTLHRHSSHQRVMEKSDGWTRGDCGIRIVGGPDINNFLHEYILACGF